ncbi:hypothetical protein D0Y65_022093, partial [Glycine soja]
VSGERNIGMRKAIAQSKWAKSTGPKNKPEKTKIRTTQFSCLLSELNRDIQCIVKLQHYENLEDMVHQAKKVERQLERKHSYKKTYHYDSSSGKDKSKKDGSSPPKQQGADGFNLRSNSLKESGHNEDQLRSMDLEAENEFNGPITRTHAKQMVNEVHYEMENVKTKPKLVNDNCYV